MFKIFRSKTTSADQARLHQKGQVTPSKGGLLTRLFKKLFSGWSFSFKFSTPKTKFLKKHSDSTSQKIADVAAANLPKKAAVKDKLNTIDKTPGVIEIVQTAEGVMKGKLSPTELYMLTNASLALDPHLRMRVQAFLENPTGPESLQQDVLATGDENAKVLYQLLSEAQLRKHPDAGTFVEDLLATVIEGSDDTSVQKTRSIEGPKPSSLLTGSIRTQVMPPTKNTLRAIISEVGVGARLLEVEKPDNPKEILDDLKKPAGKRSPQTDAFLNTVAEARKRAHEQLDSPPVLTHGNRLFVPSYGNVYLNLEGQLTLAPTMDPIDKDRMALLKTTARECLEDNQLYTTAYNDKIQIKFEDGKFTATLSSGNETRTIELPRRTSQWPGVKETESNEELLNRFIDEELEMQLLILESGRDSSDV